MEETSFKLTDLPEDWRVIVDSHSSSPIFADENTQLVATGFKMGIVDGHYVIDNTQMPNKEIAHQSLRDKEAKQAEMFKNVKEQFPDAAEKLAVKQLSGGKR